MRRIIFVFIISFFCNSVYADWFEINSFNKAIAFSKIAKLGKVSIFVVSTSWCGPCHVLEKALKSQSYDMTLVDIYIIDMAPKGKNNSDLQNTDAYNIWMSIENLESWPTIYVTSQTSNLKAIFNGKGKDKDVISRINRIVNGLLDQNKYFVKDLVLPKSPTSIIKVVNTSQNIINCDKGIKSVKRELGSCIVEKNKMQNRINKFTDSISVLDKNYKLRVKAFQDSISLLDMALNRTEISNQTASSRLQFLETFDIKNCSLTFFKNSNELLKKTKNRNKAAYMNFKANLNFSAQDTIVNFTIKIKNINKSNNAHLTILCYNLNLNQGINSVNIPFTLSNSNSKQYLIEMLKYGVVVYRDEYRFRR